MKLTISTHVSVDGVMQGARWPDEDRSADSSAADARRVGGCRRPEARSAVKHRPADVVAQPLVVEYERANRLRQLGTLPPALESPCAVALALRRAGARGLDRIGGRTKFVRGDVRDNPRLAGSVRGVPSCPA
jgi:hypothetical protein